MQLGLQPTSSDLIDLACKNSEYQHKTNIKSVYNVSLLKSPCYESIPSVAVDYICPHIQQRIKDMQAVC